jgi:hypothetical protein
MFHSISAKKSETRADISSNVKISAMLWREKYSM